MDVVPADCFVLLILLEDICQADVEQTSVVPVVLSSKDAARASMDPDTGVARGSASTPARQSNGRLVLLHPGTMVSLHCPGHGLQWEDPPPPNTTSCNLWSSRMGEVVAGNTSSALLLATPLRRRC